MSEKLYLHFIFSIVASSDIVDRKGIVDSWTLYMLLAAFSLVTITVLLQISRSTMECNNYASKSSSPSSHSVLHKPILILVKDMKSCHWSINFSNEGNIIWY